MDPPLARAPLAVSRQSRPIFHRPQSTQDWENQKAKIVDLYESNELKDTMKVMEEQHGFKATLNQYKKQLGKWGLDNKRIKDFEYQAMLKKKRKREQEDPLKESAFRLRGAEVDSSKITRYKKRKGVNEADVASDVGKQWHRVFYAVA
ncbi:hypothetical protein MMC22_011219 [Lobaria immixta]|nr:hypothetical protein [Lobaria immixta]